MLPTEEKSNSVIDPLGSIEEPFNHPSHEQDIKTTLKKMMLTRLLMPIILNTCSVVGPLVLYSCNTIHVAAGAVATAIVPSSKPPARLNEMFISDIVQASSGACH